MDWRIVVKEILDFLRDSYTYLVTSYIGGIIIILFGIWVIRDTIKYPQPKDSIFMEDFKGWFGGIICILMGFSIIVLKLMGKL